VKTVRKVTRIDRNNALQAFKPKVRVAAYCRVSTDSDEQMASLEAQKDHYESYIKANPDWEFAGIYYDEGISGTKKENRTGLLRLLADCENKKIDFIITKSVSRFARNTTDCIEMVRKLTDLGVFIYFEKENINTQRMEGELVLTILSSLAENESLSIAENSKWSIRRRFQNGTYKISYPPYGYDYVDGKLDVTEEEIGQFDYLIAGYHYGVLGEKPMQSIGLHLQNYILSGLLKMSTKRQKALNTELVVRAIYENNIKILSHPGDKGVFDIREIALACADRGTLMEISTWHDWLTVEGIKEAARTDVSFVIGSDAHTPDRIGDCQGAVSRIKAAGLDFERVTNLIVE
jgi:DNA invertase Pin-like site-specific DNA recombinase